MKALRKHTTMSTKQNDRKAIAWNTGAEYTQFGQRIAAASVDGGVWFTDVDRGIHGWMPGCHLTESAVMHRYHAGEYRSVPPPTCDLNVRQFKLSAYKDGTVTRVMGLYVSFREALEKLALAVPRVGMAMEVHGQVCTILAVHAAGTVDVEAPSGKCFRVTGLGFTTGKVTR